MNYNIRGANIEVTPALREYVEKKVGKLERYFDTTPVADVNVNMQVLNNQHIIEITIPMPQLLLRGEEKHRDMYAAIDSVVDKLERQIRKYKTKINRKFRQENSLKYMFKNDLEPLEDEPVADDELEVVRKKRFNLKPMDAEEAILQMDMLGHSFFVFSDATNGSTNIVYKRKDGKYGLIEPEA